MSHELETTMRALACWQPYFGNSLKAKTDDMYDFEQTISPVIVHH